MTKDELFHDFNLVKEMIVPIERKVRILTELMAEYEYSWRVVGITREALIRFSENKFRKVTGMGINRAHLINRKDFYPEMLGKEFKNCDDWWDYYLDKDRTILATSTENSAHSFSDVFYFDKPELFKIKSYSWRHTKKDEGRFLENLFREKCNPL